MDECPCVTVKVNQVNGSFVVSTVCRRDDCAEWRHLVVERDALRAEVKAGTAELRRYVEGNGFQWCDDESAVFNVTTAIGWLGGSIETLRAEVERLRAALRFYADEDNWHWVYPRCTTPVVSDNGERARKALTGEGE